MVALGQERRQRRRYIFQVVSPTLSFRIEHLNIVCIVQNNYLPAITFVA
jgi:hypothetical protein